MKAALFSMFSFSSGNSSWPNQQFKQCLKKQRKFKYQSSSGCWQTKEQSFLPELLSHCKNFCLWLYYSNLKHAVQEWTLTILSWPQEMLTIYFLAAKLIWFVKPVESSQIHFLGSEKVMSLLSKCVGKQEHSQNNTLSSILQYFG